MEGAPMKKLCLSCREYKEEDEFTWKYKSLGIRATSCRECVKPFRKKWYEGNKQTHLENVKERKDAARTVAREYVWNYLLSHPCVECGESDPVVLEFHHRAGKEKAVGVLISTGYSVAKIQSEIDKCDVLCANCHRRLTMKERGWFRGRK
jgi:hypothetical protein